MKDRGGTCLKPLIHRKETIYFILLLITSIPLYALLVISGLGLIILGILVFIPIIAQMVFTAYIRTNGVKITSNQFPEVFERTKEIAKDMGFYFVPDVYVIESGGMLNAFATRFFGRSMIVLYADLFEMKDSDSKAIDFVIAHELAHIKRNHIIKHALILPANWIPFLGSAYSRACEYTCDRMATHYTNDFEASTRALTMLAVGRKFYQTIDQHEYMLNSSKEKGFIIWLSEKLMSHPTLPKRIAALYHFNDVENSVVFKTPKRVFAIVFLAVVVVFGGIISISMAADKIISFVEDAYNNVEEDTSDTVEIEPDKETPLTLAILDNDIDKAKQLIDKGADVNKKNKLGESPLISTSYYDDKTIDLDMLKLLLKNGANPAIGDEQDYTVLHAAVSMGDIKAIDLLLQYKADINMKDSYGESPIFEAIYTDDAYTFQHLVDKGADLKIKNKDGLSIYDIAKEEVATKILIVLNQ